MAWETGTATDYKDLKEKLLDFITSKGTIAAPVYAGTGDGSISEVSSVSKAASETWTLACSNATKVGVADFGVTVAADSPVLHWRLGEGASYGVADYSVPVLLDTPVLYWRLDEVAGTLANDQTVNNLDGVIAGTPTMGVASLLAVDTNKALRFDGVDDVVTSTANALIQITGDMSVDLVASQTDSTGSQTLFCIEASGALEADNTLVRVQTVSGDIVITHEYGVGSVETISTGVTLLSGLTYHIALTRDVTTKTYLLYLNGTQKYSWVYTNNPTGGTNAFVSLGKSVDSSDYFIGDIDEFAIYSSKLSPATVLQHSKDSVGLLAEGITIVDETINAIDGTSIGIGSTSGLLSVDTDTAITFNGSTSKITSPTDTLFQILGDMAVEVLVSPTAVTGTRTIFSISASGAANDDNIIAQLDIVEGFIKISHEYAAGSSQTVTTGTVLEPNEDYHIVLSRNSATKTYSLYIDGIPEYEYFYVYNTSDGLNSFVTLGSNPTTNDYFVGTIDEFAIYPTQITQPTALAHAQAAKGHETFTVTGSSSGATTEAIVGVRYRNDSIDFLIEDGATDFIVTDNFVLTLTAGALGALAWEIVRKEKELVYIKGVGAGGTDNIYAAIGTYEDSGSDYYNWKLNGFDGYVQDVDLSNQINVSPSTYVPLMNQTMTYWFIANGRRFVVIAKTSTNYHCCHIGFILPFATPSQYPYPYLLGGSSGISTARWSNTVGNRNTLAGSTIGTAGFFDPLSGCAYLRLVDGSWTTVKNTWYGSGLITDAEISTHPYHVDDLTQGDLASLIREDLLGNYSLITITLFQSNQGDPNAVGILGEIDGCFQVSGFANASENIINDGSYDNLVVQDTFRTAIDNYMAVRLD